MTDLDIRNGRFNIKDGHPTSTTLNDPHEQDALADEASKTPIS